MSAFLELFDGGDTLADRMRHAARARVIVEVAKELQTEADVSLREAADVQQEATGTAFTARVDGVTALVTDPQPKPRVTDEGEFAAWFAAAYPDDVQRIDRVFPLDEGKAADAIRRLKIIESHQPNAGQRLSDALTDLAFAMDVRTEVLLPEKAVDLVVDRARVHVTADAVVDVMTGEHVPGLAVTRAKPVLQVRLDKTARAGAQRQVRDALGIPAELGGAS